MLQEMFAKLNPVYTQVISSYVANSTLLYGKSSADVNTSPSALDIAASAIAPAGLGLLAPLYQIIYGFLKYHADIDISSITGKIILAFGCLVAIQFVWSYLKPFLVTYFTSSVTLPAEHLSAKNIAKWVEAQERTNAGRHMEYMADKVQHDIATQTTGVVGEKRPKVSSGIFFFEKHPLYISSAKGTVTENEKASVSGWGNGAGVIRLSGDTLSVYSLDTSGTVLERFIEAVSAISNRTTDINVTAVYTMGSTSPDAWDLFNCRIKPQRPFSTIDLDTKIKNGLLADVDKFFSPGRLEWYSKLGLSYKRGILLSGPPGTGKSSIALALAGHIKGPLYTIALGQVPDEEYLQSLFDKISGRSVVLLEDIDSAGIVRENVTSENESDDDDEDDDRKPSKGKSKISLSGLLNTIDSLAEGFLLVMTTNEPEALDKALIRPGRIDKQVRVGCASQAVAANIFKRFYDADSEDASTDEVARISELAVQFSEKIPNLKFTPAEIQGYLIRMSDDRDEAIAGLEQFVTDLSAAKAAGKNIIGEDFE